MDRSAILDEARRCAAENGGVAPGIVRFAKETGIQPHHWRGRYWARYGDLLSEAGLTGQGLNTALDRDFLLSKLAEFVNETGRVPTASDMRLRKRTDHDFPNEKTVRARIGYGQQLAAALIEYADGKDELERVVEVCRPVALRTAPKGGLPAPSPGGIVYLMKSGRYHKIGRSNSAGRRLYEMAIQLPEQVDMVHAFETDDPDGIERYWHQRFAAKRKNGEWFDLDAADIAAFKRRKRFM